LPDQLILVTASRLVDAALAHGRALGLAPLAVAVLDARGVLKAYKAEDGTSLLRAEIATGKAWGALGMGFGGRELARRASHAPLFFNALQVMSAGRMVPVAGGVLLRARNGVLVGAIGISGDKPDNDEACAVRAAIAADLVADTGANPE
jgi:uncharacterized protein GlcG (DUF336 family)